MRLTYAEINLRNLQFNYLNIKKRVENRKIMAVVKADAYGHGMIDIVKALSLLGNNRPEYYGVALIEEAVKLRKAKIIKEPVLTFSPFDFSEIDIYKKYMNDNDLLLKTIKTIGISYSSLNKYNKLQISKRAIPKFTKIGCKYYFVAYVNSNVLKSDIGNYIFTILPIIDFSVIYSNNDYSGSTSFSLRSTWKHVDVSCIASYLGGGGHRNASGVRLKYTSNTLPGIIYDNTNRLYKNLEYIYTDTIIINKKTYNILYLNSSVHKSKLGKYLLQTKYINQKNKVQVCVAICKHFNIKCSNHIDIVAVWNYYRINNKKFRLKKHLLPRK